MHSTSGTPASNTPARTADCAAGSPSTGTKTALRGTTTDKTIAAIPE
jgi:hypothetical protein